MRTQLTISNKNNYSFESEDFELWELNSLNVADDSDDLESELSFEDESLAGNVIEFLQEAATH